MTGTVWLERAIEWIGEGGRGGGAGGGKGGGGGGREEWNGSLQIRMSYCLPFLYRGHKIVKQRSGNIYYPPLSCLILR